MKEILSDIPCDILKPFYKRSGSVTLTSHSIIFFDDLDITSPKDLENPQDNIFFFKYQKKPTSLLYKIIPLPDIRELQKRRFLGRKTAIEIFLMNGKSLMLNFLNSEDRDTFGKKILRQRSQKAFNLKYYDTLDPRKILKKRELTEQWMQWKISNFEYITLLNQLAGRSYNDLSQYPVFPWLFVDFVSQNPPDITAQHNSPMGAPMGFRDLNKNM
jgi:Beige/BEACH domain/PH domain associated with Beige/BEACH